MPESAPNQPRMISVRKNLLVGLALGITVFLLLAAAYVTQRIGSLTRRLDEQSQRIARLESAGRETGALPAEVQLSFSNDWKGLGNPDAPVTVIEFTDYECPFCRQFHQDAYKAILRQYVDSGKVRWVSRDLPLQIHAYAKKSAEAAHCAGEQGKFWEYRDALLSSDQPLSRQLLRTTATRLSLHTEKLLRCLDSATYSERVANDIADARVLQIDGTPAFVFAASSKDLLSGPLIVGSAPIHVFRATIDSLLADRKQVR
jgi:protein-disulfide isomerase